MPETSPATLNDVTRRLVEQLRNHPKRVVFTEGEDIRVIKAAAQFVALEAISPILLGNPQHIKALAAEHNIPMNFIRVIDPKITHSSSMKRPSLALITSVR